MYIGDCNIKPLLSVCLPACLPSFLPSFLFSGMDFFPFLIKLGVGGHAMTFGYFPTFRRDCEAKEGISSTFFFTLFLVSLMSDGLL